MSDTTKLSGSVTVREGITTPPAKPLTGTDIDHIPNYADAAGHDALLDLSLAQEFEELKVIGSLTGQYSIRNQGISGNEAEGISSRVTGEVALQPKQGPISSVYLWGTEKDIDLKGRPEIELDSFGGFVFGKPIDISGSTNLTLGGGARFGTLDPEIAQATAKLASGKIFTEAGYVHSLGDQNDQAFAGIGYNGDKTNVHVRQYVDVNGKNPTDNSHTQFSVSQELSAATSLYGYGTIAEGDGVKLQEVMAGIKHQLTETTSIFAEGGVTTGADPKADLKPSVQAGVKIGF